MEPIETIQRTRALLIDPNKWTKNVTAQDACAVPVNAHDPRAARWCLIGGLQREAETTREMYAAADLIEATLFNHYNLTVVNVADFNDNHTHEDLIALLDKVLADYAPAIETKEAVHV